MPLFNWPYTNLHNLNLDWIIKKIKNVETAETNTAASEEAAAGSAASAAASQEASALSEANAAGSAAQAQHYYENITENVSTLVTGWMDEHITPTTPAVDSSLTISGAAADAKVTGENISDLKNAAVVNSMNDAAWILGNLNADGKYEKTPATRVSSYNYIKYSKGDTLVNLNSTRHQIVCAYDSNYALISRSVTSEWYYEIPECAYYRICLYTDSQPISDPSSIYSNAYIIDRSRDELIKDNKLPFVYFGGALNATGVIDFTYRYKRITYTKYMSFDHDIMLMIDFQYTVIVCTYNESLEMQTRKSYAGNTAPLTQIPAGTLFRITVYKRNSTADREDLEELARAVSVYDGSCDNGMIETIESFAVIGDSLSAGFVGSSVGNISSTAALTAGRNWPTYLSKAINRPVTNLARGNSTAHDWRYGNTSLDVNINTADIDTYAYMIGLGVNDARQALTVGSNTDIASAKEDNADTFYGNYDYVIRTVKSYIDSHIKSAVIFVFTLPPTETNAEEYNEAIRYIAEKYGYVHCIDLYTLYNREWKTYPFDGTWISGHSRPIGYALMASWIKNAINMYMQTHTQAFLLYPWTL